MSTKAKRAKERKGNPSHQAEEEEEEYDSQEERYQLALRLDKEVDEFIERAAEKKRNRESKPWTPEEWEYELANHPFFMKQAPIDGSQVSPLVEGLQQLKYSADENSPDELAEAYKEDGNHQYKIKAYKMAILAYTTGLKCNMTRDDLKAQLFNNRAACHFQLKNYRSCYTDCKLALHVQPDYPKALKRLAQASLHLGLYDDCIDACDTLLLKQSDPEILKLKTEAAEKKLVAERNKRKEHVRKRKQALENKKIKDMLDERGIKLHGKGFWDQPESQVPRKVQIHEGHLLWTIVLMYPEYETTDVMEEFHEDWTIDYLLSEVLAKPPEWDVDKKYNPKSVVVDYEDPDGKIHNVKKSSTLRSVLAEEYFRLVTSTPVFYVHSEGSAAYHTFLQQYK